MKKFLFFVAIILVIFAGICTGIYLKLDTNPIDYIFAQLHIGVENTILSSDNFDETIDEFTEKAGQDSDEVYYLSYITLKCTFSNSNTDSSDLYSNLYGKTINELIEKAKSEMEADDVSLEDFKNSLNDLGSSSSDNGIIYLNK